jgi:type I restriction enzyme M protein
MSIALNKARLDNLAGEIWKSAERLRGKFKAYEYQSVILPMIVLRRLECVLLAWRAEKAAEIRAKRPKITDAEVAKLVKGMELGAKLAPFSNQTDWTLEKLYAEDHALLSDNFRNYINGFSKNVDEIIDHFNYRATIELMVKNNRLVPIIGQFKDLPIGPDALSNLEMGYVYEELLRRFSEQSGEEAGEHFTPREVIRLMVELLDIPLPDRHISIYDPACGTGGMLSVAKEHLIDAAKTPAQRDAVERLVTVHGQELSRTNYAICKADLLIKSDQQATVCLGNSLIPHVSTAREPGDQLAAATDRFDFMLSNPPFGVTWGGKDGYETEARKFEKTRYRAGMPRSNDGALLFLQTMLAKMRPADEGGSRLAIIFNGSPLSNGDCGSGESEIRRWILENDWLDAIVMLPDQLFYNTGIFTYVWLLRNEKPAARRGRVMLVDARKQFEKEPKAFGNKRNRLTEAHRRWIRERYVKGWKKGYQDDDVRVFDRDDFAYHKVQVVYWQTDANEKPAVVTESYEKALSGANLKREQAFYGCNLTFTVTLKVSGKKKTASFTLKPSDDAGKALKAALSAHADAEVLGTTWTHPDYVQDDEYVPHGEDLESWLKREVEVAGRKLIRFSDSPQLGYEILPNKYFYRYVPPTPAQDLLDEFWRLEKEAERLLRGLGK